MRKRDKLKVITEANNKLEQSYLKSKGLLKEDVVSDIQNLINNNQYLKGNSVTENDLIITNNYILYVSDESLKHIKERHSDVNKPGSIINPSVDLRKTIKNTVSQKPNEVGGGKVKWLEMDSGINIGLMGVSKGEPENVSKMRDYRMPDGGKEIVKINQGERTPTKTFNVITSEIGTVGDKTVLSLITAFPGDMSIDGVEIPLDRSDMSRLGFYFVVNG